MKAILRVFVKAPIRGNGYYAWFKIDGKYVGGPYLEIGPGVEVDLQKDGNGIFLAHPNAFGRTHLTPDQYELSHPLFEHL